MKLFTVFLCGIYLLIAPSEGYLHCPQNEVSEDCKNPCQPTCQTPYITRCDSLNCQPGCVCRPGTIRDEGSGKCVSLQYCPKACSWNEIQNNGRNGCEPTCQNQQLGFHCALQNKRCVCKPGLLRDLQSGECVTQELCPKVQCDINEEWNLCTNPLSRGSCQNRFKNLMPYTLTCIPACDCKKGFIWDEYSKKCIPEYHCPKVCGENQEWKKCNDVAWRETCQRRKSKVNAKVCMGGCSCKNGYLWDEQYNKCVPREHCSKVCQENEEWCQSVSNDVATCQNILKPQCRKYFGPSLITYNKSGCICKEGFIWNEVDKKCVLLENCSNILTSTASIINTESYTTEVLTGIASTTANINSTTPTTFSTVNTFSSSIPTSTTNTVTGSTATILTDVAGTGTVAVSPKTIIEHWTANITTSTVSNSTDTTVSFNTNTSTGTTPTNAATNTESVRLT